MGINDEELDDKDLDHSAGTVDEGGEDDENESVFIADEDDEDIKAGAKDKKGAAAEDDERLGADADSETEEQKRERRRKERKDKKAKKRQFEQQDRQELQFLRTHSQNLEQRLAAVEKGQRKQGSQVTVAQIDGRINQIQAKIDEADQLIAAAITAQNGEDVALINKERDKLRDALGELKYQRRGIAAAGRDEGGEGGDEGGEREGARTNQRQQREEIQRVIRENTRVFSTRHNWFDGKSSDSLVVMGIDQQLRNEGMSPANGAFWQTLEQRMQAALPHRFKDDNDDDDNDDDDDDDDDERVDTSSQRRVNGADAKNGKNGAGKDAKGSKGPKMAAPGGGNQRPGKTYRISKDRIDAMKEAGIWDDPKARARMVKRYAAFDRDNGITG